MKGKMKGKMIKLLAVVMSAFFIFYAGYQAWRFFYNPYQTEITTEYSVSESLHVHGIAVRSETIIESVQTSGSVSYVYEDAQRVLKNRTVAYTHASADTVDKMIRVEELEKEISLLKEASRGNSQLYGTMEFINTQIGSAVAKYAGVLDETNLSALSSAKEELLLAINKKTVITGNENKFEDRIAILNAECNELKEEISADSAETVTSPKTGYFVSEVDGFENLVNKETMFEMTAAQLEELINTEIVTVEPSVGKIADNYKWYYVISVNEEEAKSFYEGRNVEINFDGINESIETKQELEGFDEESEIELKIVPETLFYNMLKADADYLYGLEQWMDILGEDKIREIVKEYKASKTVRRAAPKIGRNDPCPCGSGKKYKHCCGRN